jgi:uncharacterized protein YyaL (SSP411 family)
MPNALSRETSPYLLQHADNPVAWLPWGPEAFARARAEDRPIFLSIGYSTCHWCHVMAHESFENPAVAEVLNNRFIPIKVDREERPDVDRVYMSYVQAATGHGGWPMSVWLTPDLKPFYGGTYLPPEDRGGRPGFVTVLQAIADGWARDRAKLVAEGERFLAAMQAAVPAAPSAADDIAGLTERLITVAGPAFEKCFHYLYQGCDTEHGGFTGAPKFPRASNISFLIRCAALQGPEADVSAEAIRMAAITLRQMAGGGIHDQVGGGFHRYSVDEAWFVPHFEKMLYDQAQIAVNALETWQATGDERLGWLARDVLDYALRDLADPAGGFYSAEDADSERSDGGGPGEGAFYTWSRAEIDAALVPEDAALVCEHFGVKADGNVPAERDPLREFTGRNILAVRKGGLQETARVLGLTLQAASDRLAAALERLRVVRESRPRPGRDEKILTAWNGLMISALARAAACPAESLADRREAYRDGATAAARFIRDQLWDADNAALGRSWRGARGPAPGFAEDYAYLIQGLLDLYEASFEADWLQWADQLQDRMDALFWDETAGGYFNSAAGATDVIVRLKEDYDGAEPAPSSVAALNLLRLDGLLGGEGRSDRRLKGLRTFDAFRSRWAEQPQALPQMLCGLELALDPPRHVVLAGDADAPGFRALADALHAKLGPRRSVIAAPARAWLAARAPWLANLHPRAGRATAYVCENFTCQPPVEDPADLQRQLASR